MIVGRKALITLFTLCLSADAFAQDASPKVGNKALIRVTPREPIACKFVGKVNGTKLWAGDCDATELRSSSSTPTTETPSLSERASGIIPPGQKQ